MEQLRKKYRRNENFVYRKIGNETVLVPIKENVGDMGSIYNLNEIGAFIWEQFDGEKTLLDIREMITEEFDVSAQQAEEDLAEFVGELREIEAIR